MSFLYAVYAVVYDIHNYTTILSITTEQLFGIAEIITKAKRKSWRKYSNNEQQQNIERENLVVRNEAIAFCPKCFDWCNNTQIDLIQTQINRQNQEQILYFAQLYNSHSPVFCLLARKTERRPKC